MTDTIVISETHLKCDESIDIPGYMCFTNNRILRNVRAKRNSGGVCILINEVLNSVYEFNVIDKSHDGILAMKFIRKSDDYNFLVVALYLPPEQTSWGRDATKFYSHVLKIIYEHSSCDNILLAGDVNGKIGDLSDFICEVDGNIRPRNSLDKTINKHGRELIDFLIESKMCVCNGRITTEFDNYTFIHPRGKSVIDYVITPILSLENCLEFRVCPPRELIDLYCDIEMDDNDLSRNIPDHSALLLTFSTDVELPEHDVSHSCHGSLGDTETSATGDSQNVDSSIYFKRFNVKNVPQDFFNNEQSARNLLDLISDIEQMRQAQKGIDDVYDKFCKMYHDEMKSWLHSVNVHPLSKKKNRKRSKPFWSEHLSYLWKSLNEAEKAFCKCNNRQRRVLRETFHAAQKNFDREYRKAKRKFLKDKILAIENFSKYNPKEFWESIKKLGPCRKSEIPMSVYDEQGNLKTDVPFVLNKWVSEYDSLYNTVPNYGYFDEEFYNNCQEESLRTNFRELEEPISNDEVKKAIDAAKRNKSVGLDNLPYEIFKDNSSFAIMTLLFNKMYDSNLVPGVWRMSLIKPIPKNSMTDPHIPLQYRGISLLSTVYKLFTSVLNHRIQSAAERHNLFVDEQNGFRSNRSCEDHIFTLTSIIRNRKKDKLDTFVTFVDFEKAFDRVDRKLLFHKMQLMGFGGKLVAILKTLYENSSVCLNINGFITPSFESKFGVKQGDSISPTLFNLYINDLIDTLNACNGGIKLTEDTQVSALLYADDLAIIADSEQNMKRQLEALSEWCRKWRLIVNAGKTKIVHFRSPAKPRSDFEFILGNSVVEYVK